MTRALSLHAPIAPDPAPESVEESVEALFRAKLREFEVAKARLEDEQAQRREQLRVAERALQGLREQTAREAATAAFPRSPVTCDRFEPVDRFLERCLGCGGPRVGHSESAIRRWVEWSSQQGRRRR